LTLYIYILYCIIKDYHQNDIIIKDIENHELYPSQIIPDKDIQTITMTLNNNEKSEYIDSFENNINNSINNEAKLESNNAEIKYNYKFSMKPDLRTSMNSINIDDDNNNVNDNNEDNKNINDDNDNDINNNNNNVDNNDNISNNDDNDYNRHYNDTKNNSDNEEYNNNSINNNNINNNVDNHDIDDNIIKFDIDLNKNDISNDLYFENKTTDIKKLIDENNNNSISFNTDDIDMFNDELTLKKINIIDENKIKIRGDFDLNNEKENIVSDSFNNMNKDSNKDVNIVVNENNVTSQSKNKNIAYNKQNNIFQNIFFTSDKDKIDNKFDKNSITFSDEDIINDMKQYDTFHSNYNIDNNNNINDDENNKNNSKLEISKQCSCTILKKIDPKKENFKNDFEEFIKKIDNNIKTGEITINDNDKYIDENIEIRNINEELKINMNYENNKNYTFHSMMDNDYDFNYEYISTQLNNDTHDQQIKNNLENYDKSIPENLSLEEYTKIFKDFEKKMDMFSKLFDPEKLEKISDIINSGGKLIRNMCKTSHSKNKNISKNKKNRMILNNIINLINSLIPNEKNNSKNKPSKNKKKKIQKSQSKQSVYIHLFIYLYNNKYYKYLFINLLIYYLLYLLC